GKKGGPGPPPGGGRRGKKTPPAGGPCPSQGAANPQCLAETDCHRSRRFLHSGQRGGVFLHRSAEFKRPIKTPCTRVRVIDAGTELCAGGSRSLQDCPLGGNDGRRAPAYYAGPAPRAGSRATSGGEVTWGLGLP